MGIRPFIRRHLWGLLYVSRPLPPKLYLALAQNNVIVSWKTSNFTSVISLLPGTSLKTRRPPQTDCESYNRSKVEDILSLRSAKQLILMYYKSTLHLTIQGLIQAWARVESISPIVSLITAKRNSLRWEGQYTESSSRPNPKLVKGITRWQPANLTQKSKLIDWLSKPHLRLNFLLIRSHLVLHRMWILRFCFTSKCRCVWLFCGIRHLSVSSMMPSLIAIW